MYELFKANTTELTIAGLTVLNTTFIYCSSNFDSEANNIRQLLENTIQIGNNEVKVLSIKVVGALIGTLPAKKLKSYFIFAIPLMKIVHDFLFVDNDEDSLVESLGSFAEIIETEPKFFKKDVDNFFDLLIKIRNVKDLDHGVKDQCLEITTSFCQRFPEILKSSQERLKKIVEMVFTHMMEISDEVDEEWKNPPDGFDEELAETDDQQVVQFSVDCIDRLISHVGKETMLPFLSDCIKTLLSSDNWKMKHSAFMAIS